MRERWGWTGGWRGLLVLAGLLLLWEALPRLGWLDPVLLPPFSRVVVRLGRLLFEGSLLTHAVASVGRVLLGYLLALALALPLGFYLGLNERAEPFSRLTVQLLRPLAPPAWIPLAVLWFGIGNVPAVFIIFIGTVLTMLLGTIGAVQGVERRLVQAALTLGASRLRAVWSVVLPATLPELLTLLRMGMGLAWMCLVAAEMVAVSQGLGYLILQARNTFSTDVVLAGMLSIGLLGLAFDAALRQLQRSLLHWQGGRKVHGLLGVVSSE
ncbi:MAG: ABC transporter permease [Chloroflexia bacterium]|nr:ABC transporter permease [Chloroflexia bacterium]